MKKFNLVLSKMGYKVCTKDGRDARILCYDYNGPQKGFPILALVEDDDYEHIIPL